MSRLHLYSSVDRLSELSFGQSNTNKPGISFPLGTGLVVLIILFVSALFSFCYHWLSIRKLSTSIDLTQQPPQAPSTSDNNPKASTKLDMLQCPPVVYMAGENMPRFIALPCPFEGASNKLASSAEEKVHRPIDTLMVKLDIGL